MTQLHPIQIPFPAQAVKQKATPFPALWDPVRKLWVVHTPEEWVRQLWIAWWLEQGVPAGLIQVEKELKVLGQSRRADIIIYQPDMTPWCMVECKAPQVPLNQNVLDQIGRYNLSAQVPYLVISNGHYTFAFHIDFAQQCFVPLDRLPIYSDH